VWPPEPGNNYKWQVELFLRPAVQLLTGMAGMIFFMTIERFLVAAG
jgi:hypothetical protein